MKKKSGACASEPRCENKERDFGHLDASALHTTEYHS